MLVKNFEYIEQLQCLNTETYTAAQCIP